jgi:hypothetical protein
MAAHNTSGAKKRTGDEVLIDAHNHAVEMRAMKLHMRGVTSSREKSIDFLKRAGLLTQAGKVKQLVRA